MSSVNLDKGKLALHVAPIIVSILALLVSFQSNQLARRANNIAETTIRPKIILAGAKIVSRFGSGVVGPTYDCRISIRLANSGGASTAVHSVTSIIHIGNDSFEIPVTYGPGVKPADTEVKIENIINWTIEVWDKDPPPISDVQKAVHWFTTGRDLQANRLPVAVDAHDITEMYIDLMLFNVRERLQTPVNVEYVLSFPDHDTIRTPVATCDFSDVLPGMITTEIK